MTTTYSYRVSQLAWSVIWTSPDEFQEEGQEILSITYCRERTAYKILGGRERLREALEADDEFIDAIFVPSL